MVQKHRTKVIAQNVLKNATKNGTQAVSCSNKKSPHCGNVT